MSTINDTRAKRNVAVLGEKEGAAVELRDAVTDGGGAFGEREDAVSVAEVSFASP